MPVLSRVVGAVTTLGMSAAATQFLAPAQDIVLPASQSATNPLEWLGANGPYFSGPELFGISSDVPENCYIDQAAYVSRHGSRYPDSGAYSGWVSMQERFQAGGYTARGSLSFLPTWQTVLTDSTLQIAMENPTGAKEAHDMGYTLRTRYPDLYQQGDEFMVWANNYTRVLQTASFFMRGFLGFAASDNGSVVSVTSEGFPGALGDSLAPSDMCPNFDDSEGGDYKTTWDDTWIPPVQKRLQALIRGKLTLTADDVSQMPYLCGFESAITGTLSPWCNVFTDEELKNYEYSNDLRYYYGIGPGTDLEKKMMTPYLNALLGLLQRGPDIRGTKADGSAFTLPKLLVSFLNDGQLAELVTSSGVFADQKPLTSHVRDADSLWKANHYVTMRGTLAFERLNCAVTETRPGRGRHTHNATYVRTRLNDAVYPLPFCRDGPGSSCLLSDYAAYIAKKYAAEGNFIENCDATVEPGTPTKVKGASFYTDLSSPWLQEIAPL
ncbi:histidine acid phosphatase [Xylariaceae sp. FL0804]|nr:histidine acid phosphatase [Xylariaceae sp. FL0804]